ncbi:hypothetical protein QUC31_017939 [Theobroma cacao]|uniref:Uncharacterized protein n=1 Tax=Theobroma cacao TaxID=3641 RepID=A0A061ED40_THECC|nr:Uncharacterized protein TCM_017303 [Theobroma cacao]WRX19854.1 hypothetical protein QQP08_012341 [Theobroma cacao]WRX20039.1 hypothetical protein QQP08_012526 [Theobroma cacao]
MDSSLLTFLANNPERSVPPPWERFFDLRLKIIFYKNDLSEALVADLRSRVNLGGGMFHESTLWSRLTGSSIDHSRYCLIRMKYDQDHPFVLQASCCCGPLMYLVVPEPVWYCPLCGHPFPIFC